MSGSSRQRPPRGPIASHFDAMTLAIALVLLLVAACAVLVFGPAEALDRVGCGLNEVVNGFLAYPRPCH